ncbi:hypothetical protein O1R50_15340 [Glycomyces luteolus]|uniref:Uncharacterized protein n=1 Tax=Glycomyces luteolus TaxID=2670330 RepID=A0A9X3SSA4_9ACTN|nr:hypothetical protein [Glycomyces luteolus]MDA1361004.1 hypothetical protein [Glycomyces luteolus]
MLAEASLRAALDARYPLPEWTIDSDFKYELTLAVALTIEAETEFWPELIGPNALLDHAERVTKAVQAALHPLLSWLEESPTDGVSYPGDPLVSYIAQLALTRPGERPDPDLYRELLQYDSRYLIHLAEHYEVARHW